MAEGGESREDGLLFHMVLIIDLQRVGGKAEPFVTYRLPKLWEKDPYSASVATFCFPDMDDFPKEEMQNESFSFVLTESDGDRRFGYCLRRLEQGSGARMPVAYVVLSYLPCFSLYTRILERVAYHYENSSGVVLTHFLESVIQNPFPAPGETCHVQIADSTPGGRLVGGKAQESLTWKFTRPDSDSQFENVDIGGLLCTLDAQNITRIFTSLLVERRVIFCSKKITKLSAVVQAIMALLYPLTWQHIYIPLLPASLLSYCCAPMPFVVGVLAASIDEVMQLPMDSVTIVLLDDNKFLQVSSEEDLGDDLDLMPARFQSTLAKQLKMTMKAAKKCTKKSVTTKRSGEVAQAITARKVQEMVLQKIFVDFFLELLKPIYLLYHIAPPGGDKPQIEDAVTLAPPDMRDMANMFVQEHIVNVKDRVYTDAFQRRILGWLAKEYPTEEQKAAPQQTRLASTTNEQVRHLLDQARTKRSSIMASPSRRRTSTTQGQAPMPPMRDRGANKKKLDRRSLSKPLPTPPPGRERPRPPGHPLHHSTLGVTPTPPSKPAHIRQKSETLGRSFPQGAPPKPSSRPPMPEQSRGPPPTPPPKKAPAPAPLASAPSAPAVMEKARPVPPPKAKPSRPPGAVALPGMYTPVPPPKVAPAPTDDALALPDAPAPGLPAVPDMEAPALPDEAAPALPDMLDDLPDLPVPGAAAPVPPLSEAPAGMEDAPPPPAPYEEEAPQAPAPYGQADHKALKMQYEAGVQQHLATIIAQGSLDSTQLDNAMESLIELSQTGIVLSEEEYADENSSGRRVESSTWDASNDAALDGVQGSEVVDLVALTDAGLLYLLQYVDRSIPVMEQEFGLFASTAMAHLAQCKVKVFQGESTQEDAGLLHQLLSAKREEAQSDVPGPDIDKLLAGVAAKVQESSKAQKKVVQEHKEKQKKLEAAKGVTEQLSALRHIRSAVKKSQKTLSKVQKSLLACWGEVEAQIKQVVMEEQSYFFDSAATLMVTKYLLYAKAVAMGTLGRLASVPFLAPGGPCQGFEEFSLLLAGLRAPNYTMVAQVFLNSVGCGPEDWFRHEGLRRHSSLVGRPYGHNSIDQLQTFASLVSEVVCRRFASQARLLDASSVTHLSRALAELLTFFLMQAPYVDVDEENVDGQIERLLLEAIHSKSQSLEYETLLHLLRTHLPVAISHEQDAQLGCNVPAVEVVISSVIKVGDGFEDCQLFVPHETDYVAKCLAINTSFLTVNGFEAEVDMVGREGGYWNAVPVCGMAELLAQLQHLQTVRDEDDDSDASDDE